MVSVVAGHDDLRRLFAALTEHTFQTDLGVADPPLTDYLTELLLRFVRTDAIFRVRDTVGKRLEEVADMLMEAEARTARPRREVLRHIGDFTLFWAGVYPEALKRLQAAGRKDQLVDYREQGKRSYFMASTCETDRPKPEEDRVLRLLSDEFEMCSFGLNRIRQEWDKLPETEWGRAGRN